MPLTVVSVTTGAIVSTLIAWAPLVPVLAAVSVCVAVTLYAPVAESAVVKVKVQAPAVQVAVPFCGARAGDRDGHGGAVAGRGAAGAADAR